MPAIEKNTTDNSSDSYTAHTKSKHSSLMHTKHHAKKIYERLSLMYPSAHAELNYSNPFELLVATVLSAQTTDIRVNSVTTKLFNTFPTPAELATADVDIISSIIKPVGFYRVKAKSIIGLANVLQDKFQGKVPKTRDELITLPGVGRKTANVVLGNAFNIPGITVDTHFGRLSRRFEWTTQTDPLKVEQDVSLLFPRKIWTELSHRMIFHGRRICHSRSPACGACYIAQLCPSYGIGVTNTIAANQLVKGPERDSLLELVAKKL